MSIVSRDLAVNAATACPAAKFLDPWSVLHHWFFWSLLSTSAKALVSVFLLWVQGTASIVQQLQLSQSLNSVALVVQVFELVYVHRFNCKCFIKVLSVSFM